MMNPGCVYSHSRKDMLYADIIPKNDGFVKGQNAPVQSGDDFIPKTSNNRNGYRLVMGQSPGFPECNK